MGYYELLLAKKLSGGGGGGGSITPEIKTALLAAFSKVAWVDENGQDYYDTLLNALYTPADLSSVSAVYSGGTVPTSTALDDLKADLVVTAHWSDQSTSTVGADYYTLSGTLVEGTSTITVTYLGKTTTFNVTATASIYPLTLTDASDYVGFGSYDATKNTLTPPYVANTNNTRIHCMGENALGYPVTYGKSYRITTQNAYAMGIVTFNEDGLAQIENIESVSASNRFDSGWINMTSNIGTYTPDMINGKEPVCMWIGFKKDNAGTGRWDYVTDVTPITIEEL